MTVSGRLPAGGAADHAFRRSAGDRLEQRAEPDRLVGAQPRPDGRRAGDRPLPLRHVRGTQHR